MKLIRKYVSSLFRNALNDAINLKRNSLRQTTEGRINCLIQKNTRVCDKMYSVFKKHC